MISKIFISYCFVILISFSHSAMGQGLDIDNFISSILENNPGVKRIIAEKDIAAGELKSSSGVDDAIISSSIKLSRDEPNNLTGSEASRSNDALLNLSYDRVYSDYGTRISLNYNNQYTDRNPALAVSGNNFYQPSFTIGVIQPLLKNAKGIQDRLNIETNEINLELAKLSVLEDVESYITQLAALYVDWYLASRELEISKEVYYQIKDQEELTRIKVERQVIEKYELLRVQETREDYYSRWQQAKGKFTGLTHQIHYQMNLNTKESEKDYKPVNPKSSSIIANEKNAVKDEDYLTTGSRLNKILQALEKQQVILLNAREDSRKYDLNLSLGYNHHGIDEQFSDAHANNMDNNDYSIMLEYKYPLGNRKATGDYETQIAKQQQIEASTEKTLIDSVAKLADLKAQLSHLIISIESIDRKIKLATEKLKEEKTLFNIGKLDLFELLNDQSLQLESRLGREKLYTQMLVLKLSIGEMLDYNLDSYEMVSNKK